MGKNVHESPSVVIHGEKLTHVVMPSLADSSHSMLGGGRVISWRVLMVQVRTYRFYMLQVFRI
jgi:hypothetical protein